jgi:hypothetical protein
MDENIKELILKHNSFFQNQKVKNPKAVDDLNNYTGFAFSAINRLLRKQKGDLTTIPDDNVEKKQIDNIDLLFSLVDPITKPITLYRGVRLEQFTSEDYAYLSTSYDISAPMQYVDHINHCCVIELAIPVGTKCLFLESISRYSNEKEVLLPRNGNFVLTAVSRTQINYDMDRFYITFLQNSAIFSKTITGVVEKAENKLAYLDEVLKVVEKTFKTDTNEYTNKLLSLYPSNFYIKN